MTFGLSPFSFQVLEEGGQEGAEKCGEEGEDGEDQGQGKSKVNDEEQDKNHLMNFVLQLESVADEDDKTQIERLWKKQLNRISMLKDSEIDSNDTDNENEDDTDSENEDDTDSENEDEDEDTFAWLDKNKNRIKKMIEEFEERGNNYFKHCNKEKIETIGTEVMAESPASLQVRMVKVLRLLEGLFYVTFCSCALRRWNWELGIVMLAFSVSLTTYLRLC